MKNDERCREPTEEVTGLRERIRLRAPAFFIRTVYPFDNNSSAKYEPSWPVIPVIKATFPSDMVVVCRLKRCERREDCYFC